MVFHCLEKKGKNIKLARDPEKVKEVKAHIESFPVVDSHYCRASSGKKYLESALNIPKMYSLYKQTTQAPVSEWIYRNIFNEFNISFFKPKKDQCDRCTQFQIKKNPNAEELIAFERHKDEVKFLKAERDKDRSNIDDQHVIICFDLQSVFSLPKGFASSFYYKRKLSVFNLTATACFINGKKLTYCAIWDEARSGRSGNDIASALMRILKDIVGAFSKIKHMTLWSDACVPQNKNKIMATALLQFLSDYPQIISITQKFSEPGHSLVQEVDCVHSAVDRYLKNVEIPSTISLIKLFVNMNFNKIQLQIIQMKTEDFLLISRRSDEFNFSTIPFTRIKFLFYSSGDLFTLNYKNSARDISAKSVSLIKKPSRTKLGTNKNIFQSKLNVVESRIHNITKEKVKDIKSLFPFLPDVDKSYYETILKN